MWVAEQRTHAGGNRESRCGRLVIVAKGSGNGRSMMKTEWN